MLHNRLKILFFGSDLYSWHSLDALCSLHKGAAGLVQDVQVVCRPPKFGGKRHKTLYKSMIYEYMEKHGYMDKLTLCDNTTELNDKLLPRMSQFDMIVCASFGLLIPAQIVNSVPFAFNLHPSLLPQYQGSSPIQTALLNQDQYTGITIQSLDPYKFDRGHILDQSVPVKIADLLRSEPKVPQTTLQGTSTRPLPRFTQRLMDQLGYISGAQLSNYLLSGRYLTHETIQTPFKQSWTRKITLKDRSINCSELTALQVYTRLHTLGPLYLDLHKQQLVLSDVEPTELRSLPSGPQWAKLPIGTLLSLGDSSFVRCKDNTALRLRRFQRVPAGK